MPISGKKLSFVGRSDFVLIPFEGEEKVFGVASAMARGLTGGEGSSPSPASSPRSHVAVTDTSPSGMTNVVDA